MKITILGCGTSTGVPMVGCRCRVCSSEDQRDKRTRASIIVENDSNIILVDTSTDLRKQAIREGISHIDAVLFTHSHADHIHGIDDLRGFYFLHKRIIPCYGSPETMEIITNTFPYIFKGREDAEYSPLLEAFPVTDRFELLGCNVTPIPLLHGTTPTNGYRFNDTAYLTDCSGIPKASREKLVDLDILIIDALRYSPHPNHFNIQGALQMAGELRPRRTILTHLTHEVPYGDRVNLPAEVEFAYDGMTLEI